jgi:hypothetical protein
MLGIKGVDSAFKRDFLWLRLVWVWGSVLSMESKCLLRSLKDFSPEAYSIFLDSKT